MRTPAGALVDKLAAVRTAHVRPRVRLTRLAACSARRRVQQVQWHRPEQSNRQEHESRDVHQAKDEMAHGERGLLRSLAERIGGALLAEGLEEFRRSGAKRFFGRLRQSPILL